MKIEATVQEIRALVRLAELGVQEPGPPDDDQQRGRAANRPQVAKALMERYQTLLDVGRLPPLAAIEHGSCSGCHVRLPTVVESEARRAPAIYNCPHCHRMLYAPEWLADGVSAAPGAGGQRRATR